MSTTVTVSPKFQVVISQEVRDFFHIRPGQRMQWMNHDGMLVLVPLLDIEELRGYLKDYDIRLIRDKGVPAS